MKNPIRILAIDGGGVGGVIPARVLEYLHAKRDRLIEQADLIAGTSTGGLIALGLARGFSPAQLRELYQQQAQFIFSPGRRRWPIWWPVRAKFSPDGLRRAVEKIAGKTTLGELTYKPVLVPVTAMRRADGSHRPAGIFLSTAYRLTHPSRHRELEKYASSRWSCLDVALATAAAPTYFPAHEVADPRPNSKAKWLCWDGGIVANNPGLAAVGEVLRLHLGERDKDVRHDQTQTPDIIVLSLGTGYRNININAGDWGLAQATRSVIATLLDANVGSAAFLLRQFLGERALRISVPLNSDYGIDDPDVVDRLVRETERFAGNRLDEVHQPDHTTVDVLKWLDQFWL